MTDELTPIHNRDLRNLDPIVGDRPPLDFNAGEVLEAEVDGSVAIGLARNVEHLPEDPSSLWSTLRDQSLSVRFAGEHRSEAFRQLLSQWLPMLEPPSRDWEASASVLVPSRDLAYVNPLVANGFAPMVVIAGRRLPNVGVVAEASRLVRTATMDDLDVLTDMAASLQHLDSHYGAVSRREHAGRIMGASLRRSLEKTPGWIWLAEKNAVPVGFIQVAPPQSAGWMAWAVRATGAAYIDLMYLRSGVRGSGLGAQLAVRAHQVLDDLTVPVTTLHYSAANPHAGPFWHRLGYRPLWTYWQRRLAVAD